MSMKFISEVDNVKDRKMVFDKLRGMSFEQLDKLFNKIPTKKIVDITFRGYIMDYMELRYPMHYMYWIKNYDYEKPKVRKRGIYKTHNSKYM